MDLDLGKRKIVISELAFIIRIDYFSHDKRGSFND
jgi:hypothetical protein